MSWIIFIILTIVLALSSREILKKDYIKFQNNYEELKRRHHLLEEEDKSSLQEILALENTAGEIIALYDTTKEICKYLDEDKIFIAFKEKLSRYISVAFCDFITESARLVEYSDCLILPLKIKMDAEPLGWLVARGISPKDLDKFHILAGQFILGYKRALLFKLVQQLAITDTLTGAFSRRYFLERLSEEMERSGKFNYNVSFLMLDVDHFKLHNDRFGHLVGDTILREISAVIRANIRQVDLFGRWGGEEFAIILPEAVKSEALVVAQRIRYAIESKNIRAYDEDLKLTVSIGVSTFPADAKNQERLIEQADEALYRAKNSGRNKACA